MQSDGNLTYDLKNAINEIMFCCPQPKLKFALLKYISTKKYISTNIFQYIEIALCFSYYYLSFATKF